MADADRFARVMESLTNVLDERTRRLLAGAEATAMGFGGVSAVARASGLSRGTVIRGMVELKAAAQTPGKRRICKEGGPQAHSRAGSREGAGPRLRHPGTWTRGSLRGCTM